MNLFQKFSVARFIDSLQYMWQGMLCIFIVIGVIILTTIVMNHLCTKAEQNKKLRDENGEKRN